jgi:hypothetical protein
MIEPSATFPAPSKIPDDLPGKERTSATRTAAPRRLSPKSILLSVLKMLLAVLPAAMGLTALGKLMLAHGRMSAPGAVATWGIVLILSFVGWGAAVNEIASPKRRFDFGLRAALGAATNLFFGGLMALLTIVSKGAILGTAVIGLGCHAFFEFRRRREVMRSWTGASRLVRDAPLFAALIALLVAAALVQYLAHAPPRGDANSHDDGLAYFGFARQLMGSGTLIEPYSLRRMQSLGGQAYLHSLVLVFGSVFQVYVVDGGIFLLLGCALVLGALGRRPRGARLAVVLALMLILSMPNTRINSSSEMTGAVFFIALYRLLSEGHIRPSAGWRAALLFGLVGAAASALRQNYIAGVALVIVFTLSSRILRARKGERLFLLGHGMLVFGAATVAIFPWLFLAYRSNGSFLFPFMKGGFNPAFSFLERNGNIVAQAQLFVSCAFYDAPVSTFGFFVLAGIVAVDRRAGRPLPAFVAAVVLGGLLLVRTFELSDASNLGRYFYALEVGLVIGVLLDIVGRRSLLVRAANSATNYPAVLAVIASVVSLLGVKSAIAGEYAKWLAADEWLDASRELAGPPGGISDEADVNYTALQQSVPAGKPLMVMLDAPYRLNFSRNRIVNLDLPGAVSPSAAIPLLKGADALAEYLQHHAIRYVAFVKDPPGFDLYQHSLWETYLRMASPTGGDVMYKKWAPFFLAAFSDFADLSKTRKHLYDGRGDITVLDLGTRVAN